jgi:hypothetical protein
VCVAVALHGPEHPRNERVWPVQFYSSVDGIVTDLMPTLVSEADVSKPNQTKPSVFGCATRKIRVFYTNA